MYSVTSPYGHLSITDSSFGLRNAKNHTFPTSKIWTCTFVSIIEGFFQENIREFWVDIRNFRIKLEVSVLVRCLLTERRFDCNSNIFTPRAGDKVVADCTEPESLMTDT